MNRDNIERMDRIMQNANHANLPPDFIKDWEELKAIAFNKINNPVIIWTIELNGQKANLLTPYNEDETSH